MLKKQSFLLIVMVTFSCGTKEETMIHEDGYYHLLSYGLQNMITDAVRDGVDEKWKIKHIIVAGCEVDEKLIDSVEIENKKTFASLEKRYGKDWKTAYDKDIEDLIKKQVDIMDVLITNKIFRNELEKYKIEIDDVYKKIKQVDDSNLYKVDIIKPNSENDICFSINVNTKERTVNLIK